MANMENIILLYRSYKMDKNNHVADVAEIYPFEESRRKELENIYEKDD
jgi:hypothetical protein